MDLLHQGLAMIVRRITMRLFCESWPCPFFVGPFVFAASASNMYEVRMCVGGGGGALLCGVRCTLGTARPLYFQNFAAFCPSCIHSLPRPVVLQCPSNP